MQSPYDMVRKRALQEAYDRVLKMLLSWENTDIPDNVRLNMLKHTVKELREAS